MRDPLENSDTAPKFAAPDPGALARWYQRALDFRDVRVFAGGDYAIVRRGQLTLHLWKCTDRRIAENTSCYTQIRILDELDALHSEWIERSQLPGFSPGRIESEPRDQPDHAMREFHVWDPAGNLIGFGAEMADGK